MKNKPVKLIFLVLILLLFTSKVALALPLPPKISLPQKQIDKSSYIPNYQVDKLSSDSDLNYYPDFSESLTKGIGFKYISNQSYLDFRINNFSNFSLPIELNNKVIFTPSSDIKIIYTLFKNI
ncbi:MAG: hypothetical protein HY776_05270 [Actinobacteria bacterium]|nr:hypothetical protein [Actinomycetota bacterium]